MLRYDCCRGETFDFGGIRGLACHLCKKNTYKGAWITGDGAIILRCCADWMVDIKMHGSSNSVDDVALLIKNAIERAIDGGEISVKYKILH